jgi:membrane associated rhomboid family serine protease
LCFLCLPAAAAAARLWTAAVVHVDATHLITNLTAVLPDCVMLEQQCGSAALAADLLLLTTTSHALYGEQQQQQQEGAQRAQQAQQQLLLALFLHF